MVNDAIADKNSFIQPNCVFYNKNTHTCRYCQDKFIDCLGEDNCEMFYNAEQAKAIDPNSTPLSGIMKQIDIQHQQLQLLAQELELAQKSVDQAKGDCAQLVAEKNDLEEHLKRAKQENTRLHDENRRASLRFANSSSEGVNVLLEEKEAEITVLEKKLQVLTDNLLNAQVELSNVQQENNQLKQTGLETVQAPSIASEELLDTVAAGIKSLGEQLLSDNKAVTEKLVLSNKELTQQLTTNSQDLSQKLVTETQHLTTSITRSHHDLAHQLLSDSEEKIKHNYHMIDQIRKQRQALDNMEQGLNKLNSSAIKSKLALAVLAGIVVGVLATLAAYFLIPNLH